MNQIFDCTQLISVSRNIAAGLQGDSFKEIEVMGFSIVPDAHMKQMRKNYCHVREDESFIELANNSFCGELENWEDLNHPPKLISDFHHAIVCFVRENRIDSMKFYLSFIAEKGRQNDYYVDSNLNDLLTTLFLISRNNFNLWADNLIINITV